MTNTAQLRRQHGEMAELASALLESAQRAAFEQTRGALAALAGKLSVHAAIEDQGVYPRLADHTDPCIRDSATRLQLAFGDLRRRVDLLAKSWLPRNTIEGAHDEFMREASALVRELGERMQAEERDLYDVLDAMAH